ncbi:NADH-quinone oxidoreductase subunit C [Desulfothermus sp.]
MDIKEYTEKILSALPKESVKSVQEFRGQVSLVVESESIIDVLKLLRDRFGYRYLIDLTAVDHLPNEPRFEVVYHLWCHSEKRLIRVKTFAKGEPPTISSVVGLWSTANWHERECYDMFGIIFDGHPDLRRILLWEGFDGHPLRKDYPVEGRDEKRNN